METQSTQFHLSTQFVSENGVLITFASNMDSSNPLVCIYIKKLLDQNIPIGITDTVPSYTTFYFEFDPFIVIDAVIEKFLNMLMYELKNLSIDKLNESHKNVIVHRLPVFYDISVAPDLDIYLNKGMSKEEVIRLHSEKEYSVFAIGFSPGFGFLGEVNPKLRQPRHSHPRQNVLAGSVAIAENQTAIYPINSPGGWNIIGHCPIKLYDPQNNIFSTLKVGDRVSFYSIDRENYLNMGGSFEQCKHY